MILNYSEKKSWIEKRKPTFFLKINLLLTTNGMWYYDGYFDHQWQKQMVKTVEMG